MTNDKSQQEVGQMSIDGRERAMDAQREGDDDDDDVITLSLVCHICIVLMLKKLRDSQHACMYPSIFMSSLLLTLHVK